MSRIVLRRLKVVPIVVAALLLSAAAAVEPRKPGPRDTCPVCGMFVAPHAEWVAQIVFADGSAVFFDGSRDLFTYLFAPDRYAPGPDRAEPAAIFVTSYYGVAPIAAESAWFVVGSDVLGPMGAELVPHATRDEAEEFQNDHGGRGIYRFDEVTPELLRNLS